MKGLYKKGGGRLLCTEGGLVCIRRVEGPGGDN